MPQQLMQTVGNGVRAVEMPLKGILTKEDAHRVKEFPRSGW